MALITFVLVVVFGGLTRSSTMMSLLNGRLLSFMPCLGCPVSQPMGDEKAANSADAGKELTLPQPVWSKLNLAWAVSLSFAVWQTSTSHSGCRKIFGQL